MARNDDLVPRQGVVLPPEGTPNGRDFSWVGTGLLDRYRGRRVAKTVKELTGSLEIATKFQYTALDYERARQDVSYIREQAKLLPLRVEQDRGRLLAEIVEIESELEAAFNRRDLAKAEHEIAMQERAEERLAVKIRVKKLKLEREQLKARGKQAPSAPAVNNPEPFERHYRTEQEVRQNRSAAETRIREIYAAALAQYRQLTPDEVEEIDSIRGAAEEAEREVRRRSASDFR